MRIREEEAWRNHLWYAGEARALPRRATSARQHRRSSACKDARVRHHESRPGGLWFRPFAGSVQGTLGQCADSGVDSAD